VAAGTVERQVQAIIGVCQSGLGPSELRDHALNRLRKVVPIDAAFFATVDPATLLFTSATADEPLGTATALLTVVSCNREGEYWLDQLGPEQRQHAAGLPLAVHAVAVQAAIDQQDRVPASPPRLRLRTREGQWLVVHASRLEGAAGSQTAIVIEPAAPSELTSIILDAYGLTPAQSRVAALVLQGRSTRQIVNELAISANTVQEHLRAVFDRFGIGSRRELVAALLSGPDT